MSEQSSNTSPTVSAFYDPASSCWRTSQGSLLSEEYPLLERLPAWGTTHGGALCAQAIPPCLLRTGGRAGSASPNLPTPRTSDTNGPGVHGNGGLDLRTAAALLPTPVVNDMGRGKTVEEWDFWTDEMKGRHGNGNGHGPSLAIEAARLLPTPTTVDSKVFGPNVDWQLRLSNHAAHTASVLMNLRSSDGNGSSDDEHQTQPMIEDCDPSSSSG